MLLNYDISWFLHFVQSKAIFFQTILTVSCFSFDAEDVLAQWMAKARVGATATVPFRYVVDRAPTPWMFSNELWQYRTKKSISILLTFLLSEIRCTFVIFIRPPPSVCVLVPLCCRQPLRCYNKT